MSRKVHAWSWEGKEKKKVGFVEDMSTLSQGRLLEELQASIRVIEEERANCGGRRSRVCIGHLCVNDFHR